MTTTILAICSLIIAGLLMVCARAIIKLYKENRKKESLIRREESLLLLPGSISEQARWVLNSAIWRTNDWGGVDIDMHNDNDEWVLLISVYPDGDIDFTYRCPDKRQISMRLHYGDNNNSEFFSELNKALLTLRPGCKECEHYQENFDWPPINDIAVGHYCELTMLNNTRERCGGFKHKQLNWKWVKQGDLHE